jgi:hypothetical protein
MERPYAFIVVTNNQGHLPNVMDSVYGPGEIIRAIERVAVRVVEEARLFEQANGIPMSERAVVRYKDPYRTEIHYHSGLITTVSSARNLIPNSQGG